MAPSQPLPPTHSSVHTWLLCPGQSLPLDDRLAESTICRPLFYDSSPMCQHLWGLESSCRMRTSTSHHVYCGQHRRHGVSRADEEALEGPLQLHEALGGRPQQ